MALGLFPPWLLERCTFDPEEKQLDIYIDLSRGGEFACPQCGRPSCKAHDTVNKVWRHLNFFQHVTYLHVRTPRASSKRGHNYITVFVDIDKSKVIFATPGKGVATLTTFKEDLEAHGGDAGNIKHACCDMSPAYIRGIEDTFENAAITFDKFHILKVINEAVDEIRRSEQRTRPELKKTRFAWLKNPHDLTLKQRGVIEDLNVPKLNLKTAKGYQIKLTFQDLYKQPREQAEEFLT